MSLMQFFQDNRETVEQNACVSVLRCSPQLSTAIGRRVIKAENSRDTSALLTNKYAARNETLLRFFTLTMGLKHAASGPHVAHECILFGMPIPFGNFQINYMPVIFSAAFESSLPSSERVLFKRTSGCL